MKKTSILLLVSACVAWEARAGDLEVDGNVTVLSNLTVQGSVTGLNASGITNGVLPAAVMPTNGTWNAGGVVISNASIANLQGGDLAEGSVTGVKLATNAVITSKIADAAVTAAKIAANTITGAQIVQGALLGGVNTDMVDGRHAADFALADEPLAFLKDGSRLGDNSCWGKGMNPGDYPPSYAWYNYGQVQHGFVDYDDYQDPARPFGFMRMGQTSMEAQPQEPHSNTGAAGSSQWGYAEGGRFFITRHSFGAMQRGHVYGSALMYMGNEASGAEQAGYLASQSTASNMAPASLQLFCFENRLSPQHALTTVEGAASILLGAGVSSNRNAIVAGDGQASHGDGSITAGGGFHGDGSFLVGVWHPGDVVSNAVDVVARANGNFYPLSGNPSNYVSATMELPMAVTDIPMGVYTNR